jgi:hypothetical protein
VIHARSRSGPAPTAPVAARGVVTVPGGRDRGAITAELALAMPAVVMVVAVLLVTASAATVQLRCADGARAAARVAALGESDAVVADVARRVAGSGVTVVVDRAGTWVDVTVAADVAGSWFTGGALGLSATSTAWVEP